MSSAEDFNGDGWRELPTDANLIDEAMYCLGCGTIYVRDGVERSCPSCTLAERLEELEAMLGGDDE